LQQQEQKKQQDGTFCFSLLFLCNLMKIFNINIKFGQNVNGVPRLGQLLYSFRTQTHHPFHPCPAAFCGQFGAGANSRNILQIYKIKYGNKIIF